MSAPRSAVARLARAGSGVAAILPGLALAAAVAIAAATATPIIGQIVPVPPVVIALLIGIAIGHYKTLVFEPGIMWTVGPLLRVAIACLGLRIALSDIFSLGADIVLLIATAMAATIAVSIVAARAFGLRDEYGALAGAANAVCGASATLATAAVLPPYPNKTADVVFTVVAANCISTVAMLLYPAVCSLLGIGARETGILLGGTIQDMAQVVGAGYAVSAVSGDTAVIVKLFRILLLVPIVMLIGRYFMNRPSAIEAQQRLQPPMFAFVFLGLAALNSYAAGRGVSDIPYETAKAVIGEFVNAALIVAIAALGLKTELRDLLVIGWRRIAVFLIGAAVIALVCAAGLWLSSTCCVSV